MELASGRKDRKSDMTSFDMSNVPKEDKEFSETVTRADDGSASEGTGFTKVKLRGVPKFLVDAFQRIELEVHIEGLFRKEGNQKRLANCTAVFKGHDVMSPDWSVHDVCSAVKRFFREMKQPLFASNILQELLALTERRPNGKVLRSELAGLFEPKRVSDTGETLHRMSEERVGTLGFLVRKLKLISDHSERNQMSVHNLATVFAPSLLRENAHQRTPFPPHGRKGFDKEHRFTERAEHDASLLRKFSDNQLRIAAVELLITHAGWIGLSPNSLYISSKKGSSSWGRSSSARPAQRTTVFDAFAMPALAHADMLSHIGKDDEVNKEDRVPMQPLVDRRASVKGERRGRMEKWTKVPTGRRSSSTMKGFVTGVTEVFSKVGGAVRRRSSAERKTPMSSRRSSPTNMRKNVLEVMEESTVRASTLPHGSSEERGGGKHRKYTERPLASKAPTAQHIQPSTRERRVERGPSARSNTGQEKSSGGPSRMASSNSLAPPTVSYAASMKGRRSPRMGRSPRTSNASNSSRPPVRSPRRQMSNTQLTLPPNECNTESSRSSLSTPSVGSSISPSVFNTNPLPRRRMQDEPVSILGAEYLYQEHKFPVERRRRHTTPVRVAAALRRNQPNTVHSGLRAVRRSTLTSGRKEDDKENQRSTGKRFTSYSRGESSDDEAEDEDEDTLNACETDCQPGMAIVYPTSSVILSEALLEQKGMEARQRRAKRQRRKGSLEGKDMVDAPGKGAVLTFDSPPPPLPVSSPPQLSLTEQALEGPLDVRRKRSMKGGERDEVEVEIAEEEDPRRKSPLFRMPALPSSSSTVTSRPQSHIVSSSTVPSNAPLTAPCSSMHSPLHPTRSDPIAGYGNAGSPLGRKGISASALDSPAFKTPSLPMGGRRQKSVGEHEFTFSAKNKAAILEATDAEQLMQTQPCVGLRPSVAMLRRSNKGVVAARVNLFASLQSNADSSISSNRSSIGSSRGSLSGTELTSSAEKPAGPPVSHGIQHSRRAMANDPRF